MGSPEVNRIPSSSSPSSPLQNSPFFNYVSSLSPLNLHNLPRVGETCAEVNFSSPPQVFASPRVNSQREAGFLKRPQYQSSSDVEKFYRQRVQNDILPANSYAARPSLYQPAVQLIPSINMETEPCSPPGSVDKFLIDPHEDCGGDAPDLCLKNAIDLPQHLQRGCTGFNETLADGDAICKDKETEPAAIPSTSEQLEENQVVERSFPHVDLVVSESHIKRICEAKQKNIDKQPDQLQDLVLKNAAEPSMSMDSASSKQDNHYFMNQTAKDLAPLLSSNEECDFVECQKEVCVCSTEDTKLHPTQDEKLGEHYCTPQMLPESVTNDQVEEITCANDGVISLGKADNQMPYDCREHAQQQRGMHRRCLQFEASEARRKGIKNKSSQNEVDVIPNIKPPASVTDSDILNASNVASKKSSSNQQKVIFQRKASYRFLTNPLRPSEDNIEKVERSAKNSENSVVTVPTPSSIGLHLNRIGSSVMDSSSSKRQLTAKDYWHVEGENSMSDCNCYLPKGLNSGFVHGNLVGNLSANVKATEDYYLACSDYKNIEQKSQASALPNSSATMHISAFKSNPLKSSLQLKLIEQHATPPEKKRGAPEDVLCSELNQVTTKKNRKKEAHGIEGEGCKRCNCKKSKCLKLYCDCFAAGIYCAGPCSCQDCFNKPEYEDTVFETRQQIESRDPLAFAPKIVQCATESPQHSGEDRTTPASVRHKRGCNCKKSKCLKKYCECYQAGVGCSVGCRCEGCENVFGKKGELGEITEMEHGNAKDEQYEEFPNQKQGRIYVNSTILDQVRHHSDHITLPMPLLQCSNYGKSHTHSRRNMTSLESEDMVLPSHGESSRSPRNSNSNNRPVKVVKQNACLTNHDPTLECQSGMADQFSSREDDVTNMCYLSPLPHFYQSGTTTSGASHARHCLKDSSQQFCHKSEQIVGFLHCSSPVTPTSFCSRSESTGGFGSESVLDNIHEDETPDILKETHSPIKTVKASSPNQKRVSPPHNCLRELRRSSSSPGLRTRKFILQSVSSFPPLSPFTELKRSDGPHTSS